MCGIVGILKRDKQGRIDKCVLEGMNRALEHRGPDGEGIWIDGSIGLGHRRLSIIDLAGGRQPMRDSERGRVITYNGEMYNFAEKRKELEKNGVQFRTKSDTEVLLKMVQSEGVEWIEQINGMFAFALWDERHAILQLVRDRLGIKPLYYTFARDEFLFASEIKALLTHPQVQLTLNPEKVPEYLAYRQISGAETMFRGIYQVMPGTVLSISSETFTPKLEQYWTEGRDKEVADYVDPELNWTDQCEWLLNSAVKYRLISDVPVGSFNSGGVDSSLNSSMMRSSTTGEMHTFSVGFCEREYDERRYANLVAEQLGTEHHTIVVDEKEFSENLERAIWHLEEPLNHSNSVQLLLLCKLAKSFVTVALSGEGADEVFGGYPRLQIPAIAQRLEGASQWGFSAAKLVNRLVQSRKIFKLLEIGNSVDCSIVENSRFVPKKDIDSVCVAEMNLSARSQVLSRAKLIAEDAITRALYFDQRTYLLGVLGRLDKMSMASGLECRVPFLDWRVVEWSYKLPNDWKIRVGRDNKRIVREVARRWLPEEITKRKKSGFGSPISDWFRNKRGLGRYIDVLSDKSFRERGLFDTGAVGTAVREHLDGIKDNGELLWALVNLELWCRRFCDRA